MTAGTLEVEGLALRQVLAERGYRSAYVIADPAVHRMLLAAGAIDRLFLTTRHRLLGGSAFHTILDQDLPAPVWGYGEAVPYAGEAWREACASVLARLSPAFDPEPIAGF